MNDPTPPDEELTTEQIVRFQILIDYHLAMEKKRQGDIGTNHISDGSEISKATWKRIEALIHDREAKAERRGRTDELETLRKELDRHAESIGLWDVRGMTLDMLAVEGKLNAYQKDEREAMVTERRALAVLHGLSSKRINELAQSEQEGSE